MLRGGGTDLIRPPERVLELRVGGNVECAILLILRSSRALYHLVGRGLIVTAFKCLRGLTTRELLNVFFLFHSDRQTLLKTFQEHK